MVIGYFVSHGSPTILIEDDPWRSHLAQLGREIMERYRPETIVVSSPHFYSFNGVNQVAVGEHLRCIQDYYGFPRELYDYCYEADNDTELVNELIKGSNGLIQPTDKWGLDHGAWIPLYLMFPRDKPKVVAVSISSAGPEHHYLIGGVIRRIAEGLGRRVIFLGTGSPTHRLDLMSLGVTPKPTRFDMVLQELINGGKFSDILLIKQLYPREYINAMPEGDLKTLHMLLGFVKPRRGMVLNYEVPWPGVSMLSAVFEG